MTTPSAFDVEAGGIAAVQENSIEDSTTPQPASTAKAFPRLVQRNLPFFQSKNKVSVIHNKGVEIAPLLRHDWFHVFLRLPSKYSLFMLLSAWTGAVLLFAGIYMAYDNLNDQETCRLGISHEEPLEFGAAFAFSVETCTTVGYGLPSGTNAFFETCRFLQFIIYVQMVWSMLFNAFLFAFLYNRLSRSESRGAQVVNSNNAIVSIVDGQGEWQKRKDVSLACCRVSRQQQCQCLSFLLPYQYVYNVASTMSIPNIPLVSTVAATQCEATQPCNATCCRGGTWVVTQKLLFCVSCSRSTLSALCVNEGTARSQAITIASTRR